MKDLALALDLKDDPQTIAEYDRYHRDVWPEILRGMAAVGVRSQRIWRVGNRLFMLLQVDDDFDWDRDFARYMRETDRAREWDDLMRTFQSKVPAAGPDDWWAPMDLVYDMNEQLARHGDDPRPIPGAGPILDSHHHFWRAARGDYHWMDPDNPILARDYMPDDLAPSLRHAGVSRTILVQAAQTEAETDFLLDIAAECDFVSGVCGWLDMDDDAFPDRLAHYRKNPWFVSFRPMLQDLEEDDWILKPRVLKNLAHVAETGVPFEILTLPRQLPHAVEAVRSTPGLKAVVNHLSKPFIKAGEMEPWASEIAVLRHYPDIYCKLSGMVTEADHAAWSPDDLRPYVAHVLDVFGPDRVMFGSDWPVALLAAQGYGEIVNALRSVIGPLLDADEHRKLFHDNAARFYGV
ncbi:MAG: amidohydrolase family protein [Azospirillaceae bacterium]